MRLLPSCLGKPALYLKAVSLSLETCSRPGLLAGTPTPQYPVPRRCSFSPRAVTPTQLQRHGIGACSSRRSLPETQSHPLHSPVPKSVYFIADIRSQTRRDGGVYKPLRKRYECVYFSVRNFTVFLPSPLVGSMNEHSNILQTE